MDENILKDAEDGKKPKEDLKITQGEPFNPKKYRTLIPLVILFIFALLLAGLTLFFMFRNLKLQDQVNTQKLQISQLERQLESVSGGE